MPDNDFKDYYDILQISPSADQDTIDSVFRHLAQRYHPDNRRTGNSDKFQIIVEAHNALKNPVERASYDVRHAKIAAGKTAIYQEITGDSSIGSDLRMQSAIVRMLYLRCRGQFRNPGMGTYQISQTLDCPPEMLEFHLWYLKEKGWIRRLDDGTFGITVDGVDRAVESERQRVERKRITDQTGKDKVIHL